MILRLAVGLLMLMAFALAALCGLGAAVAWLAGSPIPAAGAAFYAVCFLCLSLVALDMVRNI